MHFDGKYVGLIRAADTRMAGYFIALTHMLRVKDALMSTIHSVEFKEHMQLKGNKKNKKKLEWAVSFLENRSMWKLLFLLTKAIYPVLRILRLSDRSEAGMHMLYYYYLKADESLQAQREELNKLDASMLSDRFAVEFKSDNQHEAFTGDKDEEPALIDEMNARNSSEVLGDAIIELWDARKGQLVSDYAIAAYLLNPMEEVHLHATTNYSAEMQTSLSITTKLPQRCIRLVSVRIHHANT